MAEAFAEGVEAVGELSHGFGFAAESGEDRAGGGFAALFQGADELVQGFPDGRAGVGTRIPIGGILGPLEQADLPLPLSRTPASFIPSTLVDFERASTSASPNIPSVQPCCSNQ